ncbi:MAG: cytidine deaminase [Saprospiraceae bacterium]|nr:cytidine deaminase [Saprospiraceae bacterium]
MESKTWCVEYKVYRQFSDLSLNDQELMVEALKASKKAYAPYSKFLVGAALKTNGQKIITGFNQENASYPCGICAERNAIHTFGIGNDSEIIQSMAIVTNSPGQEIPFPCGFCRQVMVETEIANKNPIRLLLGHPDFLIASFPSCQSILPFSFHSGLLI